MFDVQVVGRLSPNDKLLLVQALKKGGHGVAVTGYGTNDAPALHEKSLPSFPWNILQRKNSGSNGLGGLVHYSLDVGSLVQACFGLFCSDCDASHI
ncbi:hypothetical protein Nepgr_015441 [Nepenthes gracilis]|uniref:Uncharacterized protein n=1 Tax=Nepenthes gracilis TaxID=150966 RepID=A0AAD3SMV9_NEPGR|nr:hypothetical protein Nepgr_015441 [Nepenthes gracilis]